MADFWTNRGRFDVLSIVLRGATMPTNFYVALLADTTTPTVDTNLMSDVSEIPAGNGYTAGGIQITRGDGSSGIGYDVATEDDTNDRSHFELEDLVWTASGGSLPASGTGARWAVHTTDEGTIANRRIWFVWDLAALRIVSVGQALTLQNPTIRIG